MSSHQLTKHRPTPSAASPNASITPNHEPIEVFVVVHRLRSIEG